MRGSSLRELRAHARTHAVDGDEGEATALEGGGVAVGTVLGMLGVFGAAYLAGRWRAQRSRQPKLRLVAEVDTLPAWTMTT